jgi:hypothetical protein
MATYRAAEDTQTNKNAAITTTPFDLFLNNLTTYIAIHSDTLHNASKATLHKRHFVQAAISRGNEITLVKSDTCLHKQLFTLLLKRDLTNTDVLVIMGICACIHLINQTATKPYITKQHSDIIYAIASKALRLQKIAHKKGDIKHLDVLNIMNVDLIQDLSDPIAFMTRIPNQEEFHSLSTGGIMFKQKRIAFKTKQALDHHIDFDRHTNGIIATTIRGLHFRVNVSQYKSTSYNHFMLHHKSIPPVLTD